MHQTLKTRDTYPKLTPEAFEHADAPHGRCSCGAPLTSGGGISMLRDCPICD